MYALFDTEIYNCIELRFSNEAQSDAIIRKVRNMGLVRNLMTIRGIWENFPRDFTKLNFPRFAREII